MFLKPHNLNSVLNLIDEPFMWGKVCVPENVRILTKKKKTRETVEKRFNDNLFLTPTC